MAMNSESGSPSTDRDKPIRDVEVDFGEEAFVFTHPSSKMAALQN